MSNFRNHVGLFLCPCNWHTVGHIKNFIFQSAVGQIIVVVPTLLNVVLEEDLVVVKAIARENFVVVMATVKNFIRQLLNRVVVVQVIYSNPDHNGVEQEPG